MEINNSMRRGVGKRGVSPVVASVLLILLVLVLAAIIFLWARGFIGEQVEKFGKPIEETCGSINFDVAKFGSELEIRNSGNINIQHLDIKMFKGGDSEIQQFAFDIPAGKSERGYSTLEMSDGSTPDKIIAYPALIGTAGGSNSIFTCMDSGVTL